MNVYLPKGIETNVTNNRGPTLIIFYFPIMTRAGVGKLFLNRPESNCFRSCGPRGKTQAIICFYVTIKNIKTILSSSVGKKQEAGWVWPMILGLLTLDHHVFFLKETQHCKYSWSPPSPNLFQVNGSSQLARISPTLSKYARVPKQ